MRRGEENMASVDLMRLVSCASETLRDFEPSFKFAASHAVLRGCKDVGMTSTETMYDDTTS